MLSLRRVHGGASLLILVAIIVAACSGATATTAPGGADPTPTQAAGAPTPTAPDGGAPTEPPVGIFPSFDIGEFATGLENVDSYQVSISSDGEEEFSAVVVTKPTIARRVTFGDTTIIVIGTDTWISEDGVKFEKAPSELAAGMLQAFDPALYLAAFSGPQWAQSSLAIGTEEKNGVSATHYRIDTSTLIGGLAGVPDGAAIDIWVADSGILVAFEATGLDDQGDFSIQVTNIDDPANKVEPPN
jgi:hypothetical protein